MESIINNEILDISMAHKKKVSSAKKNKKITKPIVDTLNFIKNNKLRTSACYFLDLIFFIVIILLTLNYMPTWTEYAEHSNNLVKELEGNDMSAITRISARSQEIEQTKQSMERIMGKMLLILFTAGNIIYALWCAIVQKKIRLWYISLFILMSYIIQAVLWILFGLIVNVKNLFGSITADTSNISMFIFIILCYLAYMKLFVFMTKIKDNKGLKIGFKKYMKFLMSNNFWKISWRYCLASVLFIPILIITQMPIVNAPEGVRIVLTLLLTFVVLIPYSTLSKLYLVRFIENN